MDTHTKINRKKQQNKIYVNVGVDGGHLFHFYASHRLPRRGDIFENSPNIPVFSGGGIGW